MQRRLAAILAADIVGYSRLMGQDEQGTLERLRALRLEMVEPLVSRNRGRIVKLMGDGFLVEFSSVIDAVRCSIAWHAGAETQAQASATANALTFRIGINIGDVLIEGDDIYGEGVNVASRLESMAEPGGTCISDDAYRQVRGKIDAAFEDMGDKVLKNIAEPVRVYRLSGAARSDRTASSAAAAAPEPERGPSIAILPFTNMSGDQEQEYFADGITEDIITDLSKLRGLLVIARNSSFAYKGKILDIRQVCRDLGVKFVLEGSVRKAGSRVRITAQLIEGASGGHLWAERYDRDLVDIFALQDEVTREIVGALQLKIGRPDKKAARADTADPEAYDHLLRGREQYRLFTTDGNARARQSFERATELDPDYAAAYAGLALAGLHDWLAGGKEALDPAFELAQKAKALDPALPSAYEALGNILLFKHRHGEAIAAAEEWIKLEPGNADAYASLAGALLFGGAPERTAGLIDKAKSLNPFHPFYYTLYVGMALFTMDHYDAALDALRRSAVHNPDALPPHLFTSACLGRMGRTADARAELAVALRLHPGFSAGWARTYFPYRYDADQERLIDGFRRAGLTE